MRLFVAVDLAAPTRSALDGLVARLRRDRVFDAARVTWVSADRFHITLRFLGEIAPARVDRVVAALSVPWCFEPFALAFGRLAVFPARGTPRVLHVTTEAGSREVIAVRNEATRRLAACGFDPEPRPFVPHMTIGRCRRVPRQVAGRLRAVVEAARVIVPAARIDRVVLYRSRLLRTGPRYESVLQVPLDGTAADDRPPRA